MSTTYQVLFSASAVQPASDAEDSTAGQTAGESDCYNAPMWWDFVIDGLKVFHGCSHMYMDSKPCTWSLLLVPLLHLLVTVLIEYSGATNR